MMQYFLIWIFLAGFFTSGICSNKPGKDAVVTLQTSFGNLTILLYDETPLHKNNFIKLVKSGYYQHTTFHRIIQQFMIQGGDPLSKDSIRENDGQGGPGYTIPSEINKNITHTFGAVAAARLGDQANPLKASNGSQFYIVQNHEGTPHLDSEYTVFGQVVQGFDVIDKIAVQMKDHRDRPVAKIEMKLHAKKMSRKRIVKIYNCQNFYSR